LVDAHTENDDAAAAIPADMQNQAAFLTYVIAREACFGAGKM
jgi:hypothetical protein